MRGALACTPAPVGPIRPDRAETSSICLTSLRGASIMPP